MRGEIKLGFLKFEFCSVEIDIKLDWRVLGGEFDEEDEEDHEDASDDEADEQPFLTKSTFWALCSIILFETVVLTGRNTELKLGICCFCCGGTTSEKADVLCVSLFVLDG